MKTQLRKAMCIKRYEYEEIIFLPLQVFDAEINVITICILKNKKQIALKGTMIKNAGYDVHWFFPYKTRLELNSAFSFFYDHFILIDE
jgi:hypothetical protein